MAPANVDQTIRLLLAETFDQEKLQQQNGKTLAVAYFQRPVVVRRIHIAAAGASLPKSTSFRGITQPDKFTLKLYVKDMRSGTSRFRCIGDGVEYVRTTSGQFDYDVSAEHRDVVTDTLLIEGDFSVLSVAVSGQMDPGLSDKARRNFLTSSRRKQKEVEGGDGVSWSQAGGDDGATYVYFEIRDSHVIPGGPILTLDDPTRSTHQQRMDELSLLIAHRNCLDAHNFSLSARQLWDQLAKWSKIQKVLKGLSAPEKHKEKSEKETEIAPEIMDMVVKCAGAIKEGAFAELLLSDKAATCLTLAARFTNYVTDLNTMAYQPGDVCFSFVKSATELASLLLSASPELATAVLHKTSILHNICGLLAHSSAFKLLALNVLDSCLCTLEGVAAFFNKDVEVDSSKSPDANIRRQNSSGDRIDDSDEKAKTPWNMVVQLVATPQPAKVLLAARTLMLKARLASAVRDLSEIAHSIVRFTQTQQEITNEGREISDDVSGAMQEKLQRASTNAVMGLAEAFGVEAGAGGQETEAGSEKAPLSTLWLKQTDAMQADESRYLVGEPWAGPKDGIRDFSPPTIMLLAQARMVECFSLMLATPMLESMSSYIYPCIRSVLCRLLCSRAGLTYLASRPESVTLLAHQLGSMVEWGNYVTHWSLPLLSYIRCPRGRFITANPSHPAIVMPPSTLAQLLVQNVRALCLTDQLSSLAESSQTCNIPKILVPLHSLHTMGLTDEAHRGAACLCLLLGGGTESLVELLEHLLSRRERNERGEYVWLGPCDTDSMAHALRCAGDLLLWVLMMEDSTELLVRLGSRIHQVTNDLLKCLLPQNPSAGTDTTAKEGGDNTGGTQNDAGTKQTKSEWPSLSALASLTQPCQESDLYSALIDYTLGWKIDHASAYQLISALRIISCRAGCGLDCDTPTTPAPTLKQWAVIVGMCGSTKGVLDVFADVFLHAARVLGSVKVDGGSGEDEKKEEKAVVRTADDVIRTREINQVTMAVVGALLPLAYRVLAMHIAGDKTFQHKRVSRILSYLLELHASILFLPPGPVYEDLSNPSSVTAQRLLQNISSIFSLYMLPPSPHTATNPALPYPRTRGAAMVELGCVVGENNGGPMWVAAVRMLMDAVTEGAPRLYMSAMTLLSDALPLPLPLVREDPNQDGLQPEVDGLHREMLELRRQWGQCMQSVGTGKVASLVARLVYAGTKAMHDICCTLLTQLIDLSPSVAVVVVGQLLLEFEQTAKKPDSKGTGEEEKGDKDMSVERQLVVMRTLWQISSTASGKATILAWDRKDPITATSKLSNVQPLMPSLIKILDLFAFARDAFPATVTYALMILSNLTWPRLNLCPPRQDGAQGMIQWVVDGTPGEGSMVTLAKSLTALCNRCAAQQGIYRGEGANQNGLQGDGEQAEEKDVGFAYTAMPVALQVMMMMSQHHHTLRHFARLAVSGESILQPLIGCMVQDLSNTKIEIEKLQFEKSGNMASAGAGEVTYEERMGLIDKTILDTFCYLVDTVERMIETCSPTTSTSTKSGSAQGENVKTNENNERSTTPRWCCLDVVRKVVGWGRSETEMKTDKNETGFEKLISLTCSVLGVNSADEADYDDDGMLRRALQGGQRAVEVLGGTQGRGGLQGKVGVDKTDPPVWTATPLSEMYAHRYVWREPQEDGPTITDRVNLFGVEGELYVMADVCMNFQTINTQELLRTCGVGGFELKQDGTALQDVDDATGAQKRAAPDQRWNAMKRPRYQNFGARTFRPVSNSHTKVSAHVDDYQARDRLKRAQRGRGGFSGHPPGFDHGHGYQQAGWGDQRHQQRGEFFPAGGQMGSQWGNRDYRWDSAGPHPPTPQNGQWQGGAGHQDYQGGWRGGY